MALQAENRALEAEKRQLMMRRKRLFNEFTMGLKDSGVPLEVKKRKLMELRSIVKKKNPPPPPPQPSTKSKVRSVVCAKSESVFATFNCNFCLWKTKKIHSPQKTIIYACGASVGLQ